MVGNAVFRIEGLRKSFGPVQVLDGVDLTLRSGSVTVLMGANGAGKSTLVKIVSAVHARDAGVITLTGQAYAPASPAEAIRAGVVTVHQNINDGVVAGLDVATNLTLDRLSGSGARFIFNPRRVRREARAVAERMGLRLDLNAEVSDLTLAGRQLVAIARAMAHEPRVLILRRADFVAFERRGGPIVRGARSPALERRRHSLHLASHVGYSAHGRHDRHLARRPRLRRFRGADARLRRRRRRHARQEDQSRRRRRARRGRPGAPRRQSASRAERAAAFADSQRRRDRCRHRAGRGRQDGARRNALRRPRSPQRER